MQAIVGLRNPPDDYEDTRHNVGFEVVDRLIDRLGHTWGRGPRRVHADVVEIGTGESRFVVAAPHGFMNQIGSPVRRIVDWYKLSPSDLLVIHDDIDLAFGRLRLQVGGGSGGHNGIRSVESALGSAEFNRLKVGVGRPREGVDPADHVLARFSTAERGSVAQMVDDASRVAESWLKDRKTAKESAANRTPGD